VQSGFRLLHFFIEKSAGEGAAVMVDEFSRKMRVDEGVSDYG
jgi:hypothetical protein